MFGIQKIPAAQLERVVKGLAAMAGHPVYAYAAEEYGAGWYWLFAQPNEARADQPVFEAQ